MSIRILISLLAAVALRATVVKHLGWTYTPFVDPFSFMPFSKDATMFLFIFAACLGLVNAILGPRE